MASKIEIEVAKIEKGEIIMTPLTLFNRLQKTKPKEEFIKVLRDHRPIDEYKCDKCDKRRRCN